MTPNAALLGDRPSTARAELRARVFLEAVLPLLEIVVRDSPEMARLFAGVTGQVRFSTLRAGTPSATLDFQAGRLRVLAEAAEGPGTANPTVHFQFRDVHALNRFFSGALVLPRVTGLGNPVLIAKVLRLMLSLQVLKPGPPPRAVEPRVLRVRLVLTLLTRALVRLYFGGYPPVVELVSNSPERVYQWSVESVPSVEHATIAAWLRVRRGKIKAGDGLYPHRRPFVQFSFPNVDAALRVFGSAEQMTGVRDGSVRALGSPEYTRRLALLMQHVDQLLSEG